MYCLCYHMYLIPKEGDMKKAIVSFGHGNGLNITPKLDEEVGGEESAVVVERKMTNVKIEDDRHVQAGVIPEDDWRRATYLLYLVCTHLLGSCTLFMTENGVARCNFTSLRYSNVGPVK